MRPTDSHPDQVRDLLQDAAAVVSSPMERERVERLHAEVVGLVEGEHEASERAWGMWLEEQREMADVGTARVPMDGDEVEV